MLWCCRAISQPEQQAIRERLITALDEHNDHLAKQEAVLIGKIARKDVPRDWPELIPTLLRAVRDGAHLQQGRALLVLYRVAKALASRRLAGARVGVHMAGDNVSGCMGVCVCERMGVRVWMALLRRVSSAR